MGWVVLGLAVAVVFLTSLLKNNAWPEKLTSTLATVLSVIGGVVTVLAANNWEAEVFKNGDVLQTVLVVYGGSQLIYNFIFKNTTVDNVLTEIKVLPALGNDTPEA